MATYSPTGPTPQLVFDGGKKGDLVKIYSNAANFVVAPQRLNQAELQ